MIAIRRSLVFCFAVLLAGRTLGDDVRTLRGHERWVLSLAISPDGKTLASGSGDQTLRLWDLLGEDGKSRILKRFESAVTALAFSKDGKKLAVGTWDGELLLLNANTGKVLKDLKEHNETITTIIFDPSGDYFASGSADDTLIVWDAKTGEDLLEMHQGNEYDVSTAAFSRDGERIVTGDGENDLKVWDTSHGEEIETLSGHEGPITCVAFMPDGSIVSGSCDNTVRVWTGGKATVLRGHADEVTALVLDSKGTRIISASEDKTIRIWDARTGKPQAILRGHRDSIPCLAISSDDTFIASGGNKTIRVWKIGKAAE